MIPELSPHLQAEHKPVSRELQNIPMEVRGHLPEQVRGMFCRNSPNPQFEPVGKYHWFDGDGMVHGVELKDGRAFYTNRYIRTRAFEAEHKAGKALWTGILEPPDLKNPLGPIKDTANTDLIWHRGKLVATWWLSGAPYQLSVPSLETDGLSPFAKDIPFGMCAHPKVDYDTGELIFFSFNLYKRPYYHYGVVSADGVVSNYQPIDIPYPHIGHDLAVTPNYSVLFDFPLGWDPVAITKGKYRISFMHDRPSRFGVIPRHGDASQIRWFAHDSCYMYHSVAAYEEGDTIRIVGCRIEDPIPVKEARRDDVPKLDIIQLTPEFYEWTLHLETGKVSGRTLDDRWTEFPRANDWHLTRSLRYSYNPRVAQAPLLTFDGYIKYDLQDGSSVEHSLGAGWVGGEAVFVPRDQESNDEDDGWVVTIATHAADEQSELLVIDAKNFDQKPVARARLPQRIPPGFHACWCPL